MDVGELTIRVSEIQGEGMRHLIPAAADFSQGVFEAVGQVNASASFLAGYGVHDGFSMSFGHTGYDKFRSTTFDVNIEFDRSKQGLMNFLEGRRKHLKNRGARFCILTRNYSEKPGALLRGSAHVDNSRRFSFSFVNRARPSKDSHEPQAIEACIAMEPLVNLERSNGLAKAMSGQTIKLTWTTIRAVAVDEFSAFKSPFHIGHREPPQERDSIEFLTCLRWRVLREAC
jgi:hypothetical protein